MGKTPLQLDPAGRLAGDHPCARCNYNLRGLAPDATCPECGLAVAISTTGNLLSHADPKWLNRLLRGTYYALGAVLLAVGCFLMMLIGVDPFGLLLALAIMVVSPIMSILAIVHFTAPQPNTPPEETTTARQATRSACFVLVFALLISVFDKAYLHGMMIIPVLLVAAVVAVIGSITLGRHAATLAARIPDPKLEYHARLVGSGIGISIIPALLGSTFLIHVGRPFGTTLRGSGAILLLVSIIAVGAIVILSIWAIVLIYQFSEAMARAVEFARGIWTKQD